MSKLRSSRRAATNQRSACRQALSIERRQGAGVKDLSKVRSNYRELMQSQILAAWPLILQGLIEKAMSGGYQQAKLLLDMCELATMEPQASGVRKEEQLCDALLENLRLEPPKR